MSKPFDNGQVVRSFQNGFRDDFLGANTPWNTGINGNWNVTVGAGMGVSIDGSSNLKITSGTTAGSVTTLTSIQTFSIPFRTLFFPNLNQKIANCDIYYEIVNQSGDSIGLAWTGTFPWCQIQSIIGGTTVNGTNAPSSNGAVSNSNYVWGIDTYFDEIAFINKGMTYGSNMYSADELGRVVWTNKLPDPTQQYNVRIRIVNGATAPVSSTTVTTDFISIQDISLVNMEFNRARGAGTTNASSALPAYITGAASYTQNVAFASSQTITAYPYRTSNTDTTTSLGASGTYTGTARMTNSAATKFVALAASDQAGTFYIDYNPDGSTWYLGIASVALVAGDAKILEIRQLSYGTQYYRVRYVNGSTAQTKLSIFSEYVSQ